MNKRNKELKEIIKFTKIFKHKMTGHYEKLSEIIIEHPEIMLESHKPDTDILYWYMRKNKIIVVELNEFEFKDKVIALSTIRNFRKRLRDFLEKTDLALKTAYDLKIKGKRMRCAISKGKENGICRD